MHLLFYVPQMAAYGGIERHVCSLAAAAADEGHHVRLITTSNSLGKELRAKLHHLRIDFRELPSPRMTASGVTKLVWLYRASRRAEGTPWDIIYTNGQSGLARVVWSASSKATRIIHHHHNAADPAEQKTWSWLFRTVLRHAPNLIGCSRATCERLNAAVGRSDTAFLPYLTACPIDRSQIAERPPSRPLRFGLCGRLIPEKGIETMIALANDPELPDIEWHIHGAGEAYPPAAFEGKSRMHYHGAYQSVREHASALLALDAAVLFSTHNEGMPLSLIEGMSAGLPWIATDQGGTAELIHALCESVLIPAQTKATQIVHYVRALADDILLGRTSRRRQREAYDRSFAPAIVTKLWMDFFAG